MEKKESDIDPRIWKGNDEFLKDSKNYIKTEGLHYNWQQVGIKEQLVDNNESITPTTDKGYLDKDTFFQEVFTKLEALEEKNQNPDYYKGVPHDLRSQIQSQDNLGEFLRIQKKAIKPLSDEVIFIKKYQYDNSNTSEVLRFGINLQYKDLGTKISDYNKDPLISTNITSQTNTVITGNSSKTEKLKSLSQKIKLTDIENDLMDNAVNYLETTNASSVLVDVFKREKSGSGKIDDITDTHTVVLYNTGNKKQVIDPSNPTFSCHLANYDVNKLIVDYSDKIKIYTPPNKDSEAGKIPFNKYGSVTGLNEDQYRDCSDIAVKLAFVLNAKNLDTTVSTITNTQSAYKLLPAYTEQFPLRLKQSSEIEHSYKMTKALTLLNVKYKDYVKTVKTKYSDVFESNVLFDKIDEEYKEIFNKISNNGLNDFKNLYNNFSNHTSEGFVESEIIGDIIN